MSEGRCGGRAGRGAAGSAAAALRGLGALLPSGRGPGPDTELRGGRLSRSRGTGGGKPSSLGEVPGAASEARRSPAARLTCVLQAAGVGEWRSRGHAPSLPFGWEEQLEASFSAQA